MPSTSPQQQNLLRVMVVDDTKLFRSIMIKVLSSIEGVEVVEIAEDGRDALQKLQHTSVDVVFLDVEMPEMNGIQTLKVIKSKWPKLMCIMVSGHNQSNVEVTIDALNQGAYDFVSKPSDGSATESENNLRQQLHSQLRTILWQRQQTGLRLRQQGQLAKSTGRSAKLTSQENSADSTEYSPEFIDQAKRRSKSMVDDHDTCEARQLMDKSRQQLAKAAPALASRKKKPASMNVSHPIEAVLIGISTGGPAALTTLVKALSPKIRVPILIVQHMPPKFTASFAESLNTQTALTVKEASDAEQCLKGHIYIAPGGRHMEVERREGGMHFTKLTDNPPVNSCRPAVDALFISAAKEYRKGVLAIIMTGMGQDGTHGVRALKKGANVTVLTQEAGSCTVYGMPKAVDESGLSDASFNLLDLAAQINALTT